MFHPAGRDVGCGGGAGVEGRGGRGVRAGSWGVGVGVVDRDGGRVGGGRW